MSRFSRPFRVLVLLLVLGVLAAAIWVARRDSPSRPSESFDERHLFQGRASSTTGDYVRAIDELSQYLTLHPQDATALYHRGYCYARQGKHEAAVADFAEAARLKPGWGSAHNNLAWERFELRQFGHALQAADQAVQLAPDSPEAWDTRAVILLALDRPEEALHSVATALRLRPKFADAIRHRVEIEATLASRSPEEGPTGVIAVPPGP